MSGTPQRSGPSRRIAGIALLALGAFATYGVASHIRLDPMLRPTSPDPVHTTESTAGSSCDVVSERSAAADLEFLRAALRESNAELDEAAVGNALRFLSTIDKERIGSRAAHLEGTTSR